MTFFAFGMFRHVSACSCVWLNNETFAAIFETMTRPFPSVFVIQTYSLKKIRITICVSESFGAGVFFKILAHTVFKM